MTRLTRLAPLLLALVPAASFASPVDDDFADGVRGPQWSLLVDDPSALSLSETGGRLNLISNGGGTPINDADYLSTFRLSTASDFSIRLDYALAGYAGAGSSGDNLGLVFGVGRDLDGTDSAAIGVGYGNRFGLVADASTVAYRVDDAQTTGNTELLSPLTGTFEIDYAAASDTLTLRRLNSTFTYSLPAGTVRGTWGATDGVLVSLGGRGSGLSATTGQLTVDNFAVVSGTIVPEPAIGFVLLAGCSLARRRRATAAG